MRVAFIILSLLFVCVVGFIAHTRYQWWKFDHLEQNARKVITAAELQTWATNLLAECGTYSTTQLYQLRTNYPAKLRHLAPGGPDVSINEVNSTNSPEDWTNRPSSISLVWGSGFLGHAGFEIGPTNFISSHGHAWALGVYFYGR